MSAPTLAEIDRDEALIEAIAELCGSTRADFLRTTALGGAAMLAALARPRRAAEIGRRRDPELRAALRAAAGDVLHTGRRDGDDRLDDRGEAELGATLGAHERAHVKIIKQVLGPKAGRRPSFDFGKANETVAAFTSTAVAMEDLTVALLTGVTPAAARQAARPPRCSAC